MKISEISDKTKVSVPIVLVIVSGVVGFVRVQSQVETAALANVDISKQLGEHKDDDKEFKKLLLEINNRLSRIEWKLGVDR